MRSAFGLIATEASLCACSAHRQAASETPVPDHTLPSSPFWTAEKSPIALTRRANHFALSEVASAYVKPSCEKYSSSGFRKDVIISPHPVAIMRGVATVTTLEAGSGGRAGLA